MRRFHSLTWRLVLTAVALVALVSLLVGTATTLVMRQSLTDRLDREVSSGLARVLDGPRSPSGGAIDTRNQAPGTLIAVLDGSGGGQGIVLGYGRDETVQLSDRALEQLAGVDVTATGIATGNGGDLGGDLDGDGDRGGGGLGGLDGGGRADVSQVSLSGVGDYRLAAEKVATTTVVVGLPTEEVDEAVRSLLRTELLLGLLAVLLAGGAATLLVRRQLAPLREVAATAHAVAELPLSEGAIDLTDRVPERLTDERNEVGQVGSALNTLLDHVESSLAVRHRSEQQVRQFVADASHELRTPLATIAGYTELARRQPAATSTALDKVESESARMTSLVEDLLLLARLDSGRPLADDPVDLTKLLIEAVSDARVIGPDHTWRLVLPDEPVEVRGDEQRLHQVVTNLLTNARKHTPPGTTVTVTAEPGGFEVHDDGPGFPPDLVAHAFERFVRADEARTSTGGVGLGLALVDAIVSAHGGTVKLTSRPGDTSFAVRLA